jgi:hypothetical protein
MKEFPTFHGAREYIIELGRSKPLDFKRARKIWVTPSASSRVILIHIVLPAYTYAPEISTFPAAAMLLVYMLPKTTLTSLSDSILNVLRYVISGP